MKKLLLFVFLFISIHVFSASVDTVNIFSNSMHKGFKCVVIKPDSYNKTNAFPTLYLLHGYGGNFSNWVKKVPVIKKYADDYQMIIVCPDGAYSSWYFDSPVDTTMKFETYISKEVPAYIEANYKTIKDRNARAISGLSMGGHGGLFLSFRHADFFGACGSMSGALVIDYITQAYDMQKRLGDTITNRHYYRELSIMKEMENYPKDSLAIIMDSGTEDFIVAMSRMVHQKMLTLKIPHDYIERPGMHNWNYWTTAVQYQMLFFRNFFDKRYKSEDKKITGSLTKPVIF